MSQKSLSAPYIPASKQLPELTFKAIVLGCVLAAILGGANAYLGLKIGQTVTACIPAAIISMAVLGMFKRSNILENNIVQTIASAGEVMAAAAIFTLPALLIIGYWKEFSYFETCMITIVGGFIGVFFSIPLRRALIIEEKLVFPEGVATAEVLKAGDNKAGSAKLIVESGILAALIQFGQSGLQIFSGSISYWFYSGSTVFGFGTGLSPVMIGAGYIVGIKVAISLIVGAIVMYGFCIPLAGAMNGVPEAASAGAAAVALKGSLKYIGVGAMIVGGVAALFSVLKPIRVAISKSIATIGSSRKGGAQEILRTDKDIPFIYVIAGLIALFVPVYFLVNHVFQTLNLPISSTTYGITIALALVSTFVIGFLVASISAYMAGLVGSSSNPISGTLIASVVLMSFVFVMIVGAEIDFDTNAVAATGIAAGIIMITAIIACIGVISCDNIQDLKSGQVLGATPWKQQVALFIGAVASALVIAPVMQVLFEAYGMGGIFPREGMDAAQNLSAPQAVLIATVSKGMVGAALPMNYIYIGGAIALVAVFIDMYLKKTGKGRFPALGVALGLYLPLEVTVPIFLGGLLSGLAAKKRGDNPTAASNGVLFASGMIAGESIMGIVLAIPFAMFENTTLFKFVPDFMAPYTGMLAFFAVGMLTIRLMRIGGGCSVSCAMRK